MKRTEVSRMLEDYGIKNSTLAKFLNKCPDEELAAICLEKFRMAARIAQYENLARYVLMMDNFRYESPDLTLKVEYKPQPESVKCDYTIQTTISSLNTLFSRLITELTEGIRMDQMEQITLYQAVNLAKDQSLKSGMRDELWYRIEQLKERLCKEYGCVVNDEEWLDKFQVTFLAKLHDSAPLWNLYEARFHYSQEGLRNLEGIMTYIEKLFLQTRQQKVAARIILDFDCGTDILIQKCQHGVLQLNYATYDSANLRHNKTIELTTEGVHLVLMDYFFCGLRGENCCERGVYRLMPAAILAGDYDIEVVTRYGLVYVLNNDNKVVETFGLCKRGIIALADYLMQLAGQAKKAVPPS